MRSARRLVVLVAAAVLSAIAIVPAGADVPTTGGSGPASDIVQECPAPTPGHYTCYALRRTNLRPRAAAAAPDGFGPADLQSAYGLPPSSSATAGAGQTVYVIDAFGYPNAESDLAAYRSRYGLKVCSSGNGCFTKLNQNGATSPLPAYEPGWAAETALDLDMVSAVCPNCKITLIEADDNGDNLFVAVARATTLGAKYVSMSWGGPEDGSEPTYDATYFSHTGIVYTAAAGDGAYSAGVSYPSTSPNVVAIGGTSLVKTSGTSRGWSESVWGTDSQFGTGSGCSADETKPGWQAIIAASVCTRRAGNDISAIGDPDTGVAVYQGGWTVLGGTSAGAPIIAAVYALAGVPGGSGDHPGSYPYAATNSLNDVTAGNNGTCLPGLLCNAAAGWDGPTGLGTPQGLAAFKKPGQTVSVVNPGAQTSSGGYPVSLQIAATDVPSGPTRTFTAAGLPTGLTISASGLISGTPTALGSFSVEVTATDSTGATGSAYFRWTVGAAGSFTAVAASRLLDTRNGTGAAAGPVPAGGFLAVKIRDRGGIPAAGVSSVVMNVTVTSPTTAGYLTVYADDGKARPNTSNLNFAKGQTVSNLVVAPIGSDGNVRLFTSARAQVIADVAGYFFAGSPIEHGAFALVQPARLLDTRYGIGAATGPPPSGSTNPLVPSLRLSVLGRGGVPAAHVSAVVLNLTAIGATRGGYLTAYPSGISRPGASNLNFPAGATVPNLVVVPVGADGKVALDVQGGGGTTNLIGDVFGYYTDGTPSVPGTFAALSPARVLDTRNGTGVGGAVVRVGNGQTVSLQVTGHGGVPATGVAAVVLNVLASGPTGAGYLTVYSEDAHQPGSSNLNYAKGQTVANLVVVPVSRSGAVDLTVMGQGTTSLIADVSGYYLAG